MTEDLRVVVGLGVTGLSCIRYLKQQGYNVAVTDTRSQPPLLSALQQNHPDIHMSLGEIDTGLLKKASQIILSPGIPLTHPAITQVRHAGVPVVGDIELFAQRVQAPVIAITGTNAKSTVTTLVGKMMESAGFRVQTGGNLGTPALDLWLDQPNADVYVLELSSFQLETTFTLAPRIASILNITPDHMDRYRDLAEYQAAKHRIYQHCQTVVSNRDDPLTTCKDNTKDQWFFTRHLPGAREFGRIEKEGDIWLAYEKKTIMPINELFSRGKHEQINALAAFAIGHAFGLPYETMIQVVRTFKGLDHRCQLVRERDGVKWYNDSKGTNVGATKAAIEGIADESRGKLILIMGGIGKNADFYPLVPVLEKYARHIILIGEAALELAQVLNQRVPVLFAADMTDAVYKARDLAHADDQVLLSPACASFDMFKDYVHRGKVFAEIVERL